MPLNEGYDPTEGVVVLRQHLQEILAALSWAHTHFAALDMADAARAGRQSPTSSKITTLLARAYNHAEGYVYDGESSIQPELILPPQR